MRRFRKKVRRFVRLYWLWVSLGLVLTKVSVEAAYIERGYKAYGGEWLVLPVAGKRCIVRNVERSAGRDRRMQELLRHHTLTVRYVLSAH